MKQFVRLTIALMLFAGCQKGDIGGGPGSTTRVSIKGKLPLLIGKSNVTKSATIDDATKVLLFNTSGEVTVSDIVDGAFQIQVNKDEPVGLIFSNEAKNFLGYLTLGQGIESLPLNYLNDTVSVVNLGTLTASGNTVSSGIDILGSFMKMNSEQVQKYRYSSVNFSLLVKNPDTDRNGIIDLLEGKYFRLAFTYFGFGGTYSSTPTKLNSVSVDSYRLMMITTDSSTPAGITFSDVNGTISYHTNQKGINPNHTIFYTDLIPINAPQYTQCKVAYKDLVLYFELPTFSSTINNLTYVFPTLYYNAEGKVNKVTWEYYSVSTGALIDAARLLTNIMVQFDGNSGRINDSPSNMGPESQEYVLTTPLEKSAITNFNMAYNDIFGNHVVMGYRPQ